jgi:hypothetical protein
MTYTKIFTLSPDLTIETKRISLTNAGKYKTMQIQNSAALRSTNFLYKEPESIAKLYSALSYITGPSDNYYDDYKGSFSFIGSSAFLGKYQDEGCKVLQR